MTPTLSIPNNAIYIVEANFSILNNFTLDGTLQISRNSQISVGECLVLRNTSTLIISSDFLTQHNLAREKLITFSCISGNFGNFIINGTGVPTNRCYKLEKTTSSIDLVFDVCTLSTGIFFVVLWPLIFLSQKIIRQ